MTLHLVTVGNNRHSSRTPFYGMSDLKSGTHTYSSDNLNTMLNNFVTPRYFRKSFSDFGPVSIVLPGELL